ncbi:iron complex transport system substrate-binding protein [Pseudonocardia thermophila]|mgnify:CR=1 FL=1|jgi:ABC-type Fe3+-hydroxamate transport system, periplasmic component|uniref:Iron complex transport system substrate-binding protein n=1 Tax=Pseudonocardia thermophila TaxID=1848 RepID=A0A1M6Q596_PSETH|nr:ABC transporter substrate-binding protein [Pseudonocardia thermophila]SHK15361.1 iron complex transport system substrate-binding protein [Pseudonocardia thermophila]
MMWRRGTLAPLLVALTALLVACSSPAAPAPPAAADDGFPVTITHAYGETVVPARPQRVVALGYGDIAIAHAVGAPLVGALQNNTGDPNLPYVQPPLPADVLGIEFADTVNLEEVASYRPDLILGVTSPVILDQQTYEQLSAIAPTVVYAEELFGASMQDDARQIGRALGAEEQVEELITAAESRIAQVRGELPGLEGKTYLFGQARGEVLPMVVGEQNLSTVFMRSLGLRVPDEFANAPANSVLAPGTVGVSYEQVGMLDGADALFMTFAGPGDREQFEGNALVQQLRPVREGTYLPLTLDQAVALQAPNVVNVDWLLEQLRPTLEKVAAER